MPRKANSLSRNVRAISAALNGNERRTFSIEATPGLKLETLGGGRGSWRLRYQPRPGAAQRWHFIGDACSVSLGEAMAQARKLMLSLQVDGTDPRTKNDRRQGLTFDGLFREWLERRAKLHKRSWSDDVQRYNLHIKKRLGCRVATEIARRDVIAALNDIADNVTPITANRCLSIISAVFTWGVSMEFVELHPAMRIPKPGKEIIRERTLSDAELKAVWNSLVEVIADRRKGMTPLMARLIQALILTGQRKSEVANAPVSEIASDLWTIPASRMKAKRAHIVPLAPLALETFRTAISNNGSPLVLPGKTGNKLEPMSIGHALARLLKDLGIEDIRPHDLRRTVASNMGRIGVPEQIIGRCLAHKQSGITAQVYNQHSYSAEKRAAFAAWEAELHRIVT